MPPFRTIDEAGNRQDYEADFLPRIGDRLTSIHGPSRQALSQHFYRVQDVCHTLDGSKVFTEVRIVEEHDAKDWPR